VNLSTNFTLAEMTRSDTALRLGLENTASQEQVSNMQALAVNVLQRVRDHFNLPVKINSGLRTLLVNRAVGSKDNSDHVKGMAADIETGVPNAVLAQWIVDNCDFRQVILEFYTPGIPDSGWVHVSYNPGDNKKQVLTAARQGGKTVYLPGLVA
jgi:zinc D-Ala-D-Ala carboxypeptidase